ncbi:MAG: hypothetical protein ACLTZY_10940 [Alistipes indistinctus]
MHDAVAGILPAFSSLSDFNFSFVALQPSGIRFPLQYAGRGRYCAGRSVDGDNQRQSERAQCRGQCSRVPLFLAEGGAPGERMLGLSGGIREYGRLAGEQPKRGVCRRGVYRPPLPASGARMGAATGWMKGGWAVSLSGCAAAGGAMRRTP